MAGTRSNTRMKQTTPKNKKSTKKDKTSNHNTESTPENHEWQRTTVSLTEQFTKTKSMEKKLNLSSYQQGMPYMCLPCNLIVQSIPPNMFKGTCSTNLN